MAAIQLRRRYSDSSRAYRIMSIAMSCDTESAITRIRELVGDTQLTERERRVIFSVFRNPNKVITLITGGVLV